VTTNGSVSVAAASNPAYPIKGPGSREAGGEGSPATVSAPHQADP